MSFAYCNEGSLLTDDWARVSCLTNLANGTNMKCFAFHGNL